MTGNCHVRFWSGGGSGDALAYRNTWSFPACGDLAHRDAVGCANILSQHAPSIVTPFGASVAAWTRRTWLGFSPAAGRAQEAAPLKRPRSVTTDSESFPS